MFDDEGSVLGGSFVTGNTLFGYCEGNPNAAIGYIAGALDAYSYEKRTSASLNNSSTRRQFQECLNRDDSLSCCYIPLFCLPKAVNLGQAKDIVCKSWVPGT